MGQCEWSVPRPLCSLVAQIFRQPELQLAHVDVRLLFFIDFFFCVFVLVAVVDWQLTLSRQQINFARCFRNMLQVAGRKWQEDAYRIDLATLWCPAPHIQALKVSTHSPGTTIIAPVWANKLAVGEPLAKFSSHLATWNFTSSNETTKRLSHTKWDSSRMAWDVSRSQSWRGSGIMGAQWRGFPLPVAGHSSSSHFVIHSIARLLQCHCLCFWWRRPFPCSIFQCFLCRPNNLATSTTADLGMRWGKPRKLQTIAIIERCSYLIGWVSCHE